MASSTAAIAPLCARAREHFCREAVAGCTALRVTGRKKLDNKLRTFAPLGAMKKNVSVIFLSLAAIFLAWAAFVPAQAQTPPAPKSPAGAVPCTGSSAFLVPPFTTDYSCVGLGSVSGVPPNYGGLTLKYNNPNILLIGGSANNGNGRIYQIGVVRGTNNHIVSFTGTATPYPDPNSTIGVNNDGGVTFGPGNVLFVTRYPNNELEETKPGSSAPDRVVNLYTIPGGGVTPSVGAVGFVPAGFPGAGQMKLVSYGSGGWYTAAFTPDGNGTYDITSVTLGPTIGSGPEGIGFVPAGSPVFPPNSVVIALYGSGKVITAPLDSNGDPIPANAQDFVTGLSGVEGAFIDRFSGDLLFATYGGGNQVIRVSGFSPAPVPTAAVSRKTHGGAGPFDISLLGGGIECRRGTPSGTDYTVVVTFASPVTVGGALITSADNMATIDSPSVSGTTVTANVHSVANAQRLNVIFTSVNDGTRNGDVLVPMAVLIGDSNGDALVNSGDALQTRTRSGQGTDATNFRSDVNVDGLVNSGDSTIVRARSGTSLP